MSYRDRYQAWRTDFAADAATVQELEKIADDPREIEDRFYRDLGFGTAGMRGLLGAGTNRMNVYTVRRATKALAQYIRTFPGGAERGVAIGYDSRHFSDVFARESALVLAKEGVRAHLFDSLRPVPVLSFAVRDLHAIAGIVITASHNPSAYNGYKVYWEDGGQLPPERAEEITRRISGLSYLEAQPMDEPQARKSGLLTTIAPDLDDRYIAAVKRLAVNPELTRRVGKTLKIVYTPLHGAGNLPVRRILRDIGMENVYVVPEQELPDGDFPTVRVPNPEEKDTFNLAVDLQKRLAADLCVGTDPDCDRVGVACLTPSGEAQLLNGNQIGCLLLHYILSQKKALGTLPANAAVVKSFVSSEMARAICADFGVKLFDVLTGFKFVAEKIHEFETDGSYAFQFGFEESFGYLSGTDVRDKDGVNACMLIAEAACYYRERNMTLVDAMEALYRQYGFFGEKAVSVTLSGKDGLEKMDRLMRRLRQEPPKAFGAVKVLAVRDYLAGVRTTASGREPLGTTPSNALYYELEGGQWLCVRPSGTEPKIKIYAGVCAQDAVAAQRQIQEALSAARRALGMEE